MKPKIKILIVDDDDSIRCCLELFLSRNYDTFVASNGKEGLELWKSNKAEVIITDIYMPIMDGNELCRKIRESDKHCKIFAMSGHNNLLEELSRMNIGFDEFINKPFELVMIQTLVEQTVAEF